jgi:predicted RNA-binding protein YlqC (UPF0109 family)
MEELITKIVTAIVDHPEDIKLEKVPGDYTIIFQLAVHAEDTGKVIGKQGHTADAIRTILNAIGGKQNKKIILEIKDTHNPRT